MGKVGGVALAAMFAVLLAGCAPTELPGAPAPPAGPQAAVVAVVDGDTIESSAGTVRLIGIDAPERGECGYGEAAAQVSALLSPGTAITLTLPDGENDTDRYGRLLRYVDTADGVDVGMSVLTADSPSPATTRWMGTPRIPGRRSTARAKPRRSPRTER